MERKITTLIACYNHGKYVREAIDSIIHQSLPPKRLILIDDCSQDYTWHEMVNARIFARYIECRHHAKRKGHIASYNEGIEACETEYFHLTGADDIVGDKEFYAVATAALDSHQEAAFYTAGVRWMSEDGKLLSNIVLPPLSGIRTSGEILDALARVGNFIPGGGTVVRANIQKATPYDPSYPFAADAVNWIRILSKGYSGIFSQHPTHLYRRHSGQMTAHSSADDLERKRMGEELLDAMASCGLRSQAEGFG